MTGGGIFLNGFIDNMSISNSRVMSNLGTYGGGIRVGLAGLDSSNDNVNIHHNLISQNSGINGGGGVTLFAGSDGYTVSDNFISNNFARLNGGGILHLGLNDGGSIKNNTVAFNEVFYGGELGGDGGGIYVAGEDPPGGGVSDGAGSVMIDANLLQGNLAGAGNGGGMAAIQVNGLDVQNNPSTPSAWYELNFKNNIVGLPAGCSAWQCSEQHHRKQRQYRYKRRCISGRCRDVHSAGSGPGGQRPQCDSPGRLRADILRPGPPGQHLLA
jgi:hypothetical protein